MKRVFLALLSMLALAVLVAAQNSPSTPQAPVANENDFSGMYSFLQEGEFVQISLEGQGKVTGFVSRYGDLPSDKGAFLDQFFKTGSIDGSRIAFTTDAVHSTWFEFKGSVRRGPGKTPDDEGYYVIDGKLTKHMEDASKKATAVSRELTMKSFPQDAQVQPSKRD
jgi:hypothetical protein